MEITFPAMIRSVFDTLSLLAVNLKSILTIDCLGNFEFYDEWIIRVFVLPLAMVAIAALRFAYVRRTNPEAAKDAARHQGDGKWRGRRAQPRRAQRRYG